MARQIVDELLKKSGRESHFYDLCCGSGAISIELISRGISSDKVVMLDCSSWGEFWRKISIGLFDFDFFETLLREIPKEKKKIKKFITELSKSPIGEHEAEIFLVLQANSFGGKQIWLEDKNWRNPSFRDYWEPTSTSIRRSPANPMQPSPTELFDRVLLLSQKMKGVKVIREDISVVLSHEFSKSSIAYVDPPYQGTTSYGFDFDLQEFVKAFKAVNDCPLVVSEGKQISSCAMKLEFGGAKGGISGNKPRKHEEWLNFF